MAATYKQFLAAPSSSLLAETAALHYVTTTTSISGPTQIIKHLNTLQKQVSKKKEDVLNIIDGQNVIAFEVETGLDFQTSGGPYLPGLDDNFLSGHVASVVVLHIVTFDEAGKIAQIRLSWDQGSLLKQVDVIGKSGRNWPIRESRDQITLIQNCLKSVGFVAPNTPDHNQTVIRTRGNSTNAMRDPHASLQLFGPREELEAHEPAQVISPYGGSRPHQRSFTDILGDEPEEGSPSANRYRSSSPSKGGQGKNFQPMRIFDGQTDAAQEPEAPKTKNRFIRPNPKKFSHFEMMDGSDPQDAPKPGVPFDERPKSKHDSQWSFDDFTTPQKVKPSRTMRTQDVRHWDTDKDAVDEDAPSEHQTRPRRDAEHHFELQDDGEPMPHPTRPNVKPKGFVHNENLGLYKNQLFDKADPSSGSDRPLGNITNLKDRGKDFAPHFDITDDSPIAPQHSNHLPEGRMKAVKMMNANWSSYDKSPVQKENNPQQDSAPGDTRIRIAGDGCGSRSGTNRDWLYGDSQDDVQAVPTRKPNAFAASAVGTGPADTKINIAGDGMGGRKGTNRDWLYGDSQDDVQTVPGRKPNAAAASAVGTGPADTKINIAGDGMGGRKGTNRDWLYGDSQDDVQTVPGRKPNAAAASAAGTGPAETKIKIGGDGTGSRSGTQRDWLQDDATDDVQAIPGRKPNAAAASAFGTGPSDTKIKIGGDGMGGKAGTNRDWLYGDLSENTQPAPTRKQPLDKAKNDFWDF